MAYPISTQEADQTIDLSFDTLMAGFKKHFSFLPETRKGTNTTYQIADAALGAFSVFFMQQPSFLAQQKLLKKKHNESNAQTLFSIGKIPTDNQIRNMLDPLSPHLLTPLFDALYRGLSSGGYLKPYQSINNTLLIALDGTDYFSSKKIHCENCSTQEHKNGDVTFLHKAITPVIVKPGTSQVVSLPPEFIFPQDGHDKQDSEHAAAKRWLAEHGNKYHEHGGATILGDDLYAHQPLCEAILAQGMHFILTCKEASHTTLYEYISPLKSLGKITQVDIKRRHGKRNFIDSYRFYNGVPIRDSEDALSVNWCEITTINEKDEKVHYTAFITNHTITTENVATVVNNGRARWHIENGNNNVLKTKGYHLEHNFGHGKKHLSSLLASLNILAFLCHTILQFNDQRYQLIRDELPTRKMFFYHLHALTTYMVFQNWIALMEFMMDGLEISIVDSG